MHKEGDNIQAFSIDIDLLCIDCRYNLRGLALAGHCPECNAPIAKTTRSRGDIIISKSLQLFGVAYVFVLGTPCVLPLVVALILRLIALGRLRSNPQLSMSPKFKSQIQLLWVVTIIETIFTGITIVLLIQTQFSVRLFGMGAIAVVIGITGALGVIGLEFSSAILLGRVCHAIADKLEHKGLKETLRVLFALSVTFAVMLFGFLVGLPLKTGVLNPNDGFMASAYIVLIFDVAFAVTIIELARVVGIADRASVEAIGILTERVAGNEQHAVETASD